MKNHARLLNNIYVFFLNAQKTQHVPTTHVRIMGHVPVYQVRNILVHVRMDSQGRIVKKVVECHLFTFY